MRENRERGYTSDFGRRIKLLGSTFRRRKFAVQFDVTLRTCFLNSFPIHLTLLNSLVLGFCF